MAAALALPPVLALAQVLYVYFEGAGGPDPGFPIDDAYIFKQYAENIAAGHGFSFNPGETSFGCTSLVWPILAAIIVKALPFLGYETIVFWLGGLLYAASVLAAALLVLRKTGSAWASLFSGGLLCMNTPLMLMHAVSGMETPLTMALLIAFAFAALSERPMPVTAGLIAGLITLNRPEGAYFPAGMALAWSISRLVRRERPSPFMYIKFLLPWAVLALPAALLIHRHTGAFLPGTYLGKIVSSDPRLIERGLGQRIMWAFISLVDGWHRLGNTERVLAPVLAGGVVYQLAGTFHDMKKKAKEAWPLSGMLVMSGFLLLPGAYGFYFPVHPAFGGFYNRYIAPVYVFLVIISAIGIWRASGSLAGRPGLVKRYSGCLVPAIAAAAVAYQGWLWSSQTAHAMEVYAAEVELNTGLRMEAAHWIRENTPSNAKVMAGYTGLGVVGGECDRYVLDLGALINPDILEYYRRPAGSPEKRWENIVEYMHDKGVDYYVTFRFTPEYAGKIPDPSATQGFKEIARLGAKKEPKSPCEQIRIYRVFKLKL